MKLVQKILNKFNGLHYPQEYLCLAKETFQNTIQAYLVHDAKVIKDITKLHSFVGYNPLVFVFKSFKEIEGKDSIEIIFCGRCLQPGARFSKKDVIASLLLKKIKQQNIDEESLLYYEGVNGRHHFISAFHQTIVQLTNKWFSRKPGNVFLQGNLYKQVQIAYSLPRKICLITVGSDNLYNLFPTDLHGQVSEQHYVISLRHDGKACQQVEAAQRIVLSDMEAAAYKQVYALGKNHMQPLKSLAAFHFSPDRSKSFQLPLPQQIVAYKELQLQDAFMHGIHKLLLFKIIYREQKTKEPATLAHIHNSYATWRYKKGIQSNYFLR